MSALSIGQLARATGTKVQTIRYYEEIGLLPPPPRSEGGQRRYPPALADRLAFIRHGRELGFSIDGIRQLLSLADQPQAPCADADRLTRQHLQQVRDRLQRLQALEQELQRMLEHRHGPIRACRVIEVLADHSRCQHADH